MSQIAGTQVVKTDFSANGQQLVFDVGALNSVRFEFSGTYAFTAVFEASVDATKNDGSDGNWFPFQVASVNAASIVASHATANATQAYEANASGVQKVRVRLTAFTSAGVHRVTVTGSVTSYEPAPVVQISGSVPVTNTPALVGTNISVNTTAGSNLSSQKASAGNLFELSISNPTATAISVKLYNKASAPVVASDVPVVTETVAGGATVVREYGQIGKRFSTGIALAATALPADTDATAAVAGVHIHGTYL